MAPKLAPSTAETIAPSSSRSAPAAGRPEPVQAEASLAGWMVAGGPEPVAGGPEPAQAATSLGLARNSAQMLRERQAIFNMTASYGRLQAQPHVDARSTISQHGSVAVLGDVAALDAVTEEPGTWVNPAVDDDVAEEAGAAPRNPTTLGPALVFDESTRVGAALGLR